VRTILDYLGEVDPDRGAAHVAAFCVLAFSELRDAPLPEFALQEEGVEGRQRVVDALAKVSKPVWLDGAVRSGRLIVQVGDLNERPDLRRRYDRWRNDRMERAPRHPYSLPDPAVVLCCTEAHGIRVHWRDFAKYQRDYFPAGTFSYGMSAVNGKSPSLRLFEPAELEGVSWTIRISHGGSGVLILEKTE